MAAATGLLIGGAAGLIGLNAAGATGSHSGHPYGNGPAPQRVQAAATAIPTVSCNTNPKIFNTGYDESTGAALKNGTDQRWTVAGGYPGINYPYGTNPPGATPPVPAGAQFDPAIVGKMNDAWADSPTQDSQWVSASPPLEYPGTNQKPPPNYPADRDAAHAQGDWYYRFQFTLDPAVDPASFALHVKWLADNNVASIRVNDALQSGANLPQYPDTPYQGGGFYLANAAQTDLDSDWKTGLNTIVVQIKSAYTAEGFDAQVEPTALCPSVTVGKAVVDRVQHADQFTVGLQDGTGQTLTSVTTKGTDTTVTSEPANAKVGTAYTITDAMAAGSESPLSSYRAELVCTNTTTKENVPVDGDGPKWTFTPPDPAPYACVVTNTGVGRAFTVAKQAAPEGPAHPGDKVTYTVTVANSTLLPYTAQSPASFTDDLSGVLDDATYNNDASAGAKLSGGRLSWSGALAPKGSDGDSVTVTYSVTVERPDTGDHDLNNNVVPGTGGHCPTGTDCVTHTGVPEFTVAKTVDQTAAGPGVKVTYKVTVTNTGKAAYTAARPAGFVDDLSGVLDDAKFNHDAAGASYAAPKLSWSGPLAVGQVRVFTYSVTVNDPDTGDQRLANAIVTVGGGNCPSGSTDDACHTSTPIRSYKVVKKASASQVDPGDTVTYTVTVTNTGKADYTGAVPAVFTDDLSQVLDDATYNGDATAGARFAAPRLSWTGPLPVGKTVTITYSVTVHDPDRGDGQLHNVITTPPGHGGIGGGGNCPTGSSNPDCATATGVSVPAAPPLRQIDTGKAAAAGSSTSQWLAVTGGGLLALAAASLFGLRLRRRRTEG